MATKPSYRRALEWILENDDTEFLTDPNPIPSVTVALVADMFGKTDKIVMRDLAKRVSR